ncbi:MAG: Ig-like domain-containing protein [Chloroflexota bacterium]
MNNHLKKIAAKWTGLGLLCLLLGLSLTTSLAQSTEPTSLTYTGFSPLGAEMADPDNNLTLTSNSLPPTNLTKQDYHAAYLQATTLLDNGIDFRSRELQRLDPETCVADEDNPDACSFSVTGIQNNYLDFKNGRLYWRFCADYDEDFVGLGNIPQAADDPGDQLKINPYGYCPEWTDLTSQQKTVRVASWENEDLHLDQGVVKEINLRNQMIDAQRIFGILALAEPANLTFDGQGGSSQIDIITVKLDGTFVAGPDGEWDRVRDLGVYGLLLSTREIASVHLILGNEFMVDALRFPFSTDGTDTEQLVKDEQAKLNRALRQYELAIEIFFSAMNFNLRSADDNTTFIGDHFSDREFQLFTAASSRTVVALTEIAKRDRLLGTGGDLVAIERLENTMLNQYLQGLALAYQATRLSEDDPSTPDIDESKNNFLDNGGTEILNNIRKLMQQTQNIRAGLNPLGFDEAFVPLKNFEDLMELTCGGRTVCASSAGLLNSALMAGNDLRDSQRTFDEKFDELKAALTSLQFDYDNILTEMCGQSADNDNDGLKDFVPCGFFDNNENGRIDNASETAGLMGDNYWKILEASRELSLAARQVENLIEEIRIEEERAGQVIEVILSEGQRIGASELAKGKVSAFQVTDTIISSESNVGYVDISNESSVGVSTSSSGNANPIACIIADCGLEVSVSMETSLNNAVGTRIETANISSNELVWAPNELILAEFNSIGALKAAEAEATIEGANSAALIKSLLLKQSELLLQLEISNIQFNQVINEHNTLVDRYFLTLTQRASTVSALQESYLSKPYFRLFRDGAALEAARTLEQAQQAAYLTAKALEYYTLSPVPYMYELYRVRNPQNLRAFLDKIAIDYAPIAPEKFSKVTYRLSLAEDIFGLTDENLDPNGQLAPDELAALRAAVFQEILNRSRIIDPDTGFDQIYLPFSTTLDNRKFLNGVFNNRISRTSDSDPGCTAGAGCRGVWLNIVTDQDPAELQGDFPKLTLAHGGIASYRDGNLQEVSYDPGPALMVGRVLPDGFGGNGREAALVSAHLNLPLGAEPNTNLAYDNFYNLSIATTQWAVQLDLTNPLVNTQLDFTKIKDIELRMDTTYVTPNNRQAYVALDLQRVAAETVGEPVSSELVEQLAELVVGLPEMDGQGEQGMVASLKENGRFTQTTPDPNRFTGTVTVREPVPMGTMAMGFSIEIDEAHVVTGSLCADCGPLFKADGEVAVSGTYNPTERTITFSTETIPYPLAGRTALRIWRFDGEISQEGNSIEGNYTETVTGFITRPVVAEGTFLVSRPASIGTANLQNQLGLDVSAAIVGLNGTVDVTASMQNSVGEPLSNVDVTLAATSGMLSMQSGTTDESGQLNVTFTAGAIAGPVTITAQADDLVRSRTISVVTTAPPQTAADEVTVNAGESIVIHILANDSAVNAPLDPASVVIVAQPALGSVTVDPANGAVTYEAAADGFGMDSFTYTVADEDGVRSAETAVTVHVINPQDELKIYLPIIRR